MKKYAEDALDDYFPKKPTNVGDFSKAKYFFIYGSTNETRETFFDAFQGDVEVLQFQYFPVGSYAKGNFFIIAENKKEFIETLINTLHFFDTWYIKYKVSNNLKAGDPTWWQGEIYNDFWKKSDDKTIKKYLFNESMNKIKEDCWGAKVSDLTITMGEDELSNFVEGGKVTVNYEGKDHIRRVYDSRDGLKINVKGYPIFYEDFNFIPTEEFDNWLNDKD